jgi:hypothetical protein
MSGLGLVMLLEGLDEDTLGPINTVAPVVSGTPEVGQTLSCTTGTWTGEGTITYAYQWRRNGSNISGATSSTYLTDDPDEGAFISCRVTATDDDGTRSRLSNSVGPIEPGLVVDLFSDLFEETLFDIDPLFTLEDIT